MLRCQPLVFGRRADRMPRHVELDCGMFLRKVDRERFHTGRYVASILSFTRRLPFASDYSYRSASTGSRPDARTAGYMPKIKPTAADTPNDSAIDAPVTTVLHSAYRATIRDTP